ncbi:MAG: hypothetical protein WBB06_02970 [Chitinophagaceae bacterium]
MNAREARELTLSKRKSTDEVRGVIKVMADSGVFYATIKTEEVREPELTKAVLEAEGFNVVLDNFFSITW